MSQIQHKFLNQITKQARANSERWFPKLHDEDLISFYSLALCGEAGEVCNLAKKRMRGEYAKFYDEIEDELADVFVYLLLLADQCQVDLIKAFEVKQRICEARWGSNDT